MTETCPPDARWNKFQNYVRGALVGEGTYGQVYKATCARTGDAVAMKRIRIVPDAACAATGSAAAGGADAGAKRRDRADQGGRNQASEGMPVTAIREIKLLQGLQHPNIIRLRDVVLAPARDSVYMVFDYMEGDLAGYLSHPHVRLGPAHVKGILVQVLRGLEHLHARGIIHRDIKGSNILIGARGHVRLTDFGLAKELLGRVAQTRALPEFTNRVITLWYRPPELLLGATRYGGEVDVWSTGCIMLELFTKEAVFRAENEIQQLHVIYETCGSLDRDAHPFVRSLPWFDVMGNPAFRPRQLRRRFAAALGNSDTALDLADCLLQLDPSARPSALEALRHPWLATERPAPCAPDELPRLDTDWHELASKAHRHAGKASTATGTAGGPARSVRGSRAAPELSLELPRVSNGA